MSPPFVRTVTGDVAPSALGPTDYHEHLFQVSPLLAGDELEDLEPAVSEVADLGAAGIRTLVDLTPIGLGRNPLGLRQVSERTGMLIVMATGLHHDGHYPTDDWSHRSDVEEMARVFTRELLEGVDGESQDRVDAGATLRPCAGVIKVGIEYWRVTARERRILAAAGIAHRNSGAPVACHLELGSAALEAAQMLEEEGVPRDRIILAHADRNPDPGLHLELAASGVYLGYDGAGRTKYWPDSVLIDCLIAVAEGGGRDRILLGGDTARRSSFVAYGGLPGMSYLARRFIPRLQACGGNDLVESVMIRNPAKAFSWGGWQDT